MILLQVGIIIMNSLAALLSYGLRQEPIESAPDLG